MATKLTKTTKNKSTEHLKYPQTNLLFSLGKNDKAITVKIIPGPSEDKSSKESKIIIPEFPFFKGKSGEIIKSEKVWYFGAGSVKELTADSIGSLFLNIAKECAMALSEVNVELENWLVNILSVEKTATLFCTAMGTAVYPVDFLKSKPSSQSVTLKKVFIITGEKENEWKLNIEKMGKLLNHINGMRQLQNLPANFANPEQVEARARLMAKKYGLKITVFQMDQLEKMGCGGLVSVGKGSRISPRMIILEYKSKKSNAANLALVGKGITFDSGGISLKPGNDMHEMKYDMSGASAVLHSIAAISELKLDVNVVAAFGLAENMPDGNAIKPGDVFAAYNGKTVEVQNTDAEGRLILADLLSYVDAKFKPDLMVDLATLTGACMVALGNFYAGLFTEKEDVRKVLMDASEKSLEPVWHLPMGPLYKAMMKSDIADLNNIGDRWGGASSAASFLSAFVDEKTRWAHLDIAGIADMKKGFNVYSAVGTGFGVRLLVKLAELMVK